MRYLFVYGPKLKAAEDLLQSLGIRDVLVVGVARTDRAVDPGLLEKIRSGEHEVGLCEIDRSYRRSFNDVPFAFQVKKFRSDDQTLREWLVPVAPRGATAIQSPRVCFERALASASNLQFADHALDRADEIASHRWPFVNSAADLLARLANGESLGPTENWKEKWQVPFAGGGEVEFCYQLDGDHRTSKARWHLKKGDRTTPEAAARIYFDYRDISGMRHVFVFYVGPHPDDGSYKVNFSTTPSS